MKKLKYKKFNLSMDYLDYENHPNNKLEEWQKDNKERDFLEVKLIEDFSRGFWLHIVYTENE